MDKLKLLYENKIKPILEFAKARKKLVIILVASLAILLGLVVFLCTGSRKVNSYLKKGDKAFSEASYMLAAAKYAVAADTDPECAKAYAGMVASYALSEQEESIDAAKEAYNKAMQLFRTFSADEFNENNELIAQVCKYCNSIFENSPEKLEKLIEAFEKSMHDNEIGDQLANCYIEDAISKSAVEDYATAIDEYEKARELTPTDSRINAGIAKIICYYITDLAGEYKFEEGKNLASKYQKILSDVDFTSALEELAVKEELYSTKLRLLDAVYSAMEDYFTTFNTAMEAGEKLDGSTVIKRAFEADFSAVMALDGEADASLLSQSLSAGAYIYCPEGFSDNYTGIAAGLYPFGTLWENEDGKTVIAYYFFMGQYVNGKRNGYGVSFMKTGNSSYELFEGNWKDDLPEGEGAMYIAGTVYQRATYGNWKAGYADGTMTEVVFSKDYPDEIFTGTYEAKEGIPTVISEKTEEYEILPPEGDAKLINVLPSTSAGYDMYITSTWKEDTKIGAIGYK